MIVVYHWQVLWTAPQQSSGCIVFRATIIEHRDVWYMDDGPLSKEFCEDEQNLDDIYVSQIDPCCACTEAKYEVYRLDFIMFNVLHFFVFLYF